MPRLQQYSCESGVGSKEIDMSIFGDMRKTRSAQQDKDLKRRESRDKTEIGEKNNVWKAVNGRGGALIQYHGLDPMAPT